MNTFFKAAAIVAASFYLGTHSTAVYGQTLPVNTPVLEENLRRYQVTGRNSEGGSFLIRPLYATSANRFDSLYYPDSLQPKARKTLGTKGEWGLLTATLRQQVNTHHPYGWNDGAMIPAKGYQVLASAGAYLRYGRLHLQVQPEVVWAQNGQAPGLPASFNDSVWQQYFALHNTVDMPERFGNKAYARIFPGQSSLRVHLGKTALGVSTENLWWGPGTRNSLLMSNNAPGFPHLSFNTTAPVKTGIGSFEWQVVSGYLYGSGFVPTDTSRRFDGWTLYQPKRTEARYFNGVVVTWQPRWTPGLYLGGARTFSQYRSDVARSLDGYFPVIGSLFKKNSQDESTRGRDQMLSLFFRLVLPESKAEVYGEYGRNDHAWDSRDLLAEPEHGRAYLLGLRKYFEGQKGRSFSLFYEMTQLQVSSTFLMREAPSWYTHFQVRHGYTHRGQVLGAGIGAGGSNSQTLGLNWYKGLNQTGLSLERVVRSNDFFYNAFLPTRDFTKHWVDLSLNGNHNWVKGRYLFAANLSLVRSYNYQWRTRKMPEGPKDVFNLHASFTAGYRF